MNRLRGMRAYLGGAMDRVADGGVGWRRTIGEWLRQRSVVTLDPTNKPIDIGIEDFENRKLRHEWKRTGNFDQLAHDMRKIRCVDLRMVDISDFLVVNLDLDVHATGTYEELYLGNREKKPILVHIEQGKEACPDWLFGTIPHEHIFSAWYQLHDYLRKIDGDPDVAHDKRWMFFCYEDKAIKENGDIDAHDAVHP